MDNTEFGHCISIGNAIQYTSDDDDGNDKVAHTFYVTQLSENDLKFVTDAVDTAY